MQNDFKNILCEIRPSWLPSGAGRGLSRADGIPEARAVKSVTSLKGPFLRTVGDTTAHFTVHTGRVRTTRYIKRGYGQPRGDGPRPFGFEGLGFGVWGARFGGNNYYFTEMCSGSEAGSYLRLIDFVYHSTLGLRVIKK